MSQDHFYQLLGKLKSCNQDERETALERLVEIGDPVLIKNALTILDSEGYRLHPITVESIAIQISLGSNSALDSIVEYAKESPVSRIGCNCISLLGEVGYLQSSRIDSRLIPTLVEIAKVSFRSSEHPPLISTDTFSACIYALRECVRSTPLTEGKDLLNTILNVFFNSEEKLDDLLLLPILEIIFSYEKENLLVRLKKLIHENPPRSEIIERINDFLEGKEIGNQWW